MKTQSTIKDFVKEIIIPLLKSDRDVVIGTAGMTGEGKSVFDILVSKEYAKQMKQEFTFDRMTWSRKELMKWIDGEGENKEGQLEEYSYVMPDELIAMFFGRSWYEDQQKESIRVFNTCRDRHLMVIGAVPNFWGLDGGFRERVRFYVFIPERGKAWVFQQEVNPFVKDPWNVIDNTKRFRKKKNPYTCPNFVTEILYPDLSKEEKEEYKSIRAEKRSMINEDSKERVEKYGLVKRQRDILLRNFMTVQPQLTINDIHELTGMSTGMISMIKNGVA